MCDGLLGGKGWRLEGPVVPCFLGPRLHQSAPRRLKVEQDKHLIIPLEYTSVNGAWCFNPSHALPVARYRMKQRARSPRACFLEPRSHDPCPYGPIWPQLIRLR